jgi:hypothetical protein
LEVLVAGWGFLDRHLVSGRVLMLLWSAGLAV